MATPKSVLTHYDVMAVELSDSDGTARPASYDTENGLSEKELHQPLPQPR